MEKLGSQWTDFHEIWYFSISLKFDFIKIWQEYPTKIGTVHEHLCTFMIISRCIILRMRCLRQKLQRKSKHTFFVKLLFSRKSRRLWDNVENCGRTRHATDINVADAHCVLDNATEKHSEYVIFIGFSQHQCLHERSQCSVVSTVSCSAVLPNRDVNQFTTASQHTLNSSLVTGQPSSRLSNFTLSQWRHRFVSHKLVA